MQIRVATTWEAARHAKSRRCLQVGLRHTHQRTLIFHDQDQRYTVLDTPTGPLLVPGGGSQYITGAHDYTTYATFTQPGFTDPPSLAGKPGAGTHGALALPLTDPIDAWGISNNLSWKIADSYTFTSITGLRRYIGQYSIEVGGSPTPAQCERI